MTKRDFSAGGIVVKKWGRDFRILLIKDGYGRWTWPKGHPDKGESSKDAALREIKEEVGLKSLRILKKVGQTQYFFKLKGELIFKTVFIYLVQASGNEKIDIQQEEIKEASWFAPEKALKQVEYKGSSEMLKKAIDIYKKSRINPPTKSITVKP